MNFILHLAPQKASIQIGGGGGGGGGQYKVLILSYTLPPRRLTY